MADTGEKGGVLLSADAAQRTVAAVRQVECMPQNPARGRSLGSVAGQPGGYSARITGSIDGNGNFPAVITQLGVTSQGSAGPPVVPPTFGYSDFGIILVRAANGETLTDSKVYRVKPAGNVAGVPLFEQVGIEEIVIGTPLQRQTALAIDLTATQTVLQVDDRTFPLPAGSTYYIWAVGSEIMQVTGGATPAFPDATYLQVVRGQLGTTAQALLAGVTLRVMSYVVSAIGLSDATITVANLPAQPSPGNPGFPNVYPFFLQIDGEAFGVTGVASTNPLTTTFNVVRSIATLATTHAVNTPVVFFSDGALYQFLIQRYDGIRDTGTGVAFAQPLNDETPAAGLHYGYATNGVFPLALPFPQTLYQAVSGPVVAPLPRTSACRYQFAGQPVPYPPPNPPLYLLLSNPGVLPAPIGDFGLPLDTDYYGVAPSIGGLPGALFYGLLAVPPWAVADVEPLLWGVTVDLNFSIVGTQKGYITASIFAGPINGLAAIAECSLYYDPAVSGFVPRMTFSGCFSVLNAAGPFYVAVACTQSVAATITIPGPAGNPHTNYVSVYPLGVV